MFDTDSDVLYDIEPTATEKPKASTVDSAAEVAKKTAEAEKRESAAPARSAKRPPSRCRTWTMDDIRRLMESSVDPAASSDLQAEIEPASSATAWRT